MIGAPDIITSQTTKKSKNTAFRRKQTTNKVRANIFKGFQLITNVQLMFRRPKNRT